MTSDRARLLEGEVVLLSGVGPDLGRHVALALAGHGAKVVLGARTRGRCQQVAEEVTGILGGEALALELDVTDQASCEQAVSRTEETFGRIDVLVNNAAHFGTFKRFLDRDVDDWRETFEVNLWGTLRLTHAVAEGMKGRGSGRIVMVNSMAAMLTAERLGAYTTSKGALAASTRSLATELGPFGIRVNGLHAGYIWGERLQQFVAHSAQRRGISFETQRKHMEDLSCLRYIPDAAEIAGPIVFLASGLSNPVTGQALHANAGHFLP